MLQASEPGCVNGVKEDESDPYVMKLPTSFVLGAIASLLLLAAWTSTPFTSSAHTPVTAAACAEMDPDPPVYYAIDLVPTRKVPGARMAEGQGDVTFATSPFGVSISENGQYVYNLSVAMENVRLGEDKALDIWVTTPNLDQIRHIGRLDDELRTTGKVDWNKFLVVVTLESSSQEPGATWTGPIVARGMSRSGLMHTMAGHGPFESEPCAVYGYR